MMKLYQTYEFTFQGKEPEGSEVFANLKAVFEIDGEQTTVEGFYDGKGVYKVRFLPQKTGTYHYRISGIVELRGEEECVVGSTKEKQICHGLVRAKGKRFVFEDGTRFLPFGTTIYAMLHQPEALLEETFSTLRENAFNKVRLCVFPKYYDYNHDEPEYFPFEKREDGSFDVHHPCYRFWQRFEKNVERLQALGIQTDLILFHPYDKWGFATMTTKDCEVYLQYVMRRFAAIPAIWWSMANEYDVIVKRTIEDWHRFEELIVEHDPYHHLLSNHNCLKFYDNSRERITHLSLQTAWVEKAADWLAEYQKPVLFDECCYEGDLPQNWGNISGFEMVHRFWSVCTVGAYATHGEVFLSKDEVLWWAKGGKLKGESPKRIAFLKSILEELPGTLEEWPTGPMGDTELAENEAILNFYVNLKNSLSEVEIDALNRKDKDCRGRIGDGVFLWYLGHHCNRVVNMTLPEQGNYRVEVIDVWNMTREPVFADVNGKISVPLPGREGMAVLAHRK